jgi:hypothetical protein
VKTATNIAGDGKTEEAKQSVHGGSGLTGRAKKLRVSSRPTFGKMELQRTWTRTRALEATVALYIEAEG